MTLHEDVARRKESLAELADRIWGTPEVALEEHRSSRALAEFLRAEGFRVEMGVADMPTAFVESVAAGLVDQSYPPDRIKTERYGGVGGT